MMTSVAVLAGGLTIAVGGAMEFCGAVNAQPLSSQNLFALIWFYNFRTPYSLMVRIFAINTTQKFLFVSFCMKQFLSILFVLQIGPGSYRVTLYPLAQCLGQFTKIP